MNGIGMLVAYAQDGTVVATLSHVVKYDPVSGEPLGLVDFAAHEDAGSDHTDIWVVDVHNPTNPVKGSKVWPEWLGAGAHDFKVELSGPPGRKAISALVHTATGKRRERSAVEGAISSRIAAARGGVADISDLVGGPDRPMPIDSKGDVVVAAAPAARPNLPIVARR